MCNTACIEFGRDRLTPDEVRGKDVIEVGALDVNGSLRSLVEGLGPRSYVGVDIAAGPGVDVVCDAYELLDRFGPERFDLLVSTEMIEHAEDWRRVVHNFKRLVRPGGAILITTRSQGFRYHGYPYDFWRFEPADMAQIFDDCEVQTIEADPTSPGVFLLVRRPADFVERDTSPVALYSVVAGRRTVALTAADRRRFQRRYEVRRFLRRLKPRAIWARLRGGRHGDRA